MSVFVCNLHSALFLCGSYLHICFCACARSVSPYTICAALYLRKQGGTYLGLQHLLTAVQSASGSVGSDLALHLCLGGG